MCPSCQGTIVMCFFAILQKTLGRIYIIIYTHFLAILENFGFKNYLKMSIRLWSNLPKEFFSFGCLNLLVFVGTSLDPSCKIETTLGKPYGIKWRCYWERLKEQTWELREPQGNLMGTQWEQGGKNNFPLPQGIFGN
jgi:hypothetical protein